jgi:hypothetical protein
VDVSRQQSGVLVEATVLHIPNYKFTSRLPFFNDSTVWVWMPTRLLLCTIGNGFLCWMLGQPVATHMRQLTFFELTKDKE